MFVMNCSVVTDEKLRVPLKLKGESQHPMHLHKN